MGDLKVLCTYKMVIKQEELDLGKFTIEEVDGGKNFRKAWFNYHEKLPIVELEGTFRAYSKVFEGRRVYSLGVDIYKTKFDFRGLQKKLSELAGESLPSDPELFKMIKETRNGSRMVYLRVLTNSYETPQSIVNERGGCLMDFEDLIGKEFEGRCNMLISYAFKGRTKGFMISADRIVEIEPECD